MSVNDFCTDTHPCSPLTKTKRTPTAKPGPKQRPHRRPQTRTSNMASPALTRLLSETLAAISFTCKLTPTTLTHKNAHSCLRCVCARVSMRVCVGSVAELLKMLSSAEGFLSHTRIHTNTHKVKLKTEGHRRCDFPHPQAQRGEQQHGPT